MKRSAILCFVAAMFFYMVAAARFSFHDLSGGPKVSQDAEPALSIEPRDIDLGKVRRAGACSYTMRIRNRTDAAVVVQRLELSCDCITVQPDRAVLAPGETVELTAKIDLAGSPKFTGDLLVAIRGVADNGQTFSSRAALTVVPE